MDIARLCAAAAAYPPPPAPAAAAAAGNTSGNTSNMQFSYGTAGFRTKGDLLASTVFRCGALAAVRSYITGKATVGRCRLTPG